jgi:DNA (cytosine-5)-methyltransferase 1
VHVQYIELFAGCGGLSLGLKSIGFKLVMANELSPMAAESYAYNFFNEDLSAEAEKKTPELKKTLWLSSKYPLKMLKSRLREDPREFPATGEGQCDLKSDGSNLSGGLVVGSIVELNKWLKENPKVAKELKSGLGSGSVDLISGGPPCQSFSMAGLRQLDSDKNSLPWEFAKFTQTVQPKLVLLENVTGILRPFKDQDGKSFYAWFELAKAFTAIGYVPLCLHVNAKVAGVPQNRPRFILLGVRADIFKQLRPTFNDAEKLLFQQPYEFFQKTKTGADVGLDELMYRDVSRSTDLELFNSSFLKPLVISSEKYVTVRDAIDDLRQNGAEGSTFSEELLKAFSKVLPKRKMQNHELRTNNPLVRRRFRLYQVLQQVGNDTRKNVLGVLRGQYHELGDTDWKQLSEFDYLVESGKFVRFKNKKEFLSFLDRHPTKKQTQKALLADQPAPAALSIPDDACHYHHDEQRTLTVREMARVQSFPDNFIFRSKITTGGKMRSFEVPQYTQVGNAVPPLLGRALGLAVSDLLVRLKK